MKKDLVSKKDEVVYESPLPIDDFTIHEGILRLYVFHKNEWKCHVIDMHALSCTEVTLQAKSRYGNLFLPSSSAYIDIHRICSDHVCFSQIVKVSEDHVEVLENHLSDFAFDVSVSPCERFLAYATRDGIHINDLISGKQGVNQCEKVRIFNWSKQKQLLSYDEINRRFLVVDQMGIEQHAVELPTWLGSNTVWKASISPSGKALVYHTVGNKPGAKGDGLVLLCSLQTYVHRIISDKAKVYGIEWSETERLISISGVNKRDLLDISYGHKMRNATYHDKEILDTDGKLVAKL